MTGWAKTREALETHQIAIYLAAILTAVALALALPETSALEAAIAPALAVMLFATFLQVPIADLGRGLLQLRFLGSLVVANFVAVPVLVAVLLPLLPGDAMLRLGVLLVLLTPCIDYVVTFAHLGRADARLLLAATPLLLVLQMLLLPVYLTVLLGEQASDLVRAGPFLHAFVWLIAVPLALAAMVQFMARRSPKVARGAAILGMLPVPATALVLFLVFAAIVPQLGEALESALQAAPIYIVYAIVAPLTGWGVARAFGLGAPAGRATAFSTATRNSLVVLPLALAVPGAMPVLPAVIVTQTIVELVFSLLYIRLMPSLGGAKSARG